MISGRKTKKQILSGKSVRTQIYIFKTAIEFLKGSVVSNQIFEINSATFELKQIS